MKSPVGEGLLTRACGRSEKDKIIQPTRGAQRLRLIIITWAILIVFSSITAAQEEDKTPPKIKDFHVNPMFFSPNGDGVEDVTVIWAEADEEVEWEVSISKGANLILATYTARGYSFTIKWDGWSEVLAATVPNGRYTIYIHATDSSGNHKLITTWVNVLNSTTPQSTIEQLKKAKKDTDHDGLTDEEEKAKGTNPYLSDTDDDGYIDSEDPNPLDPGKPGKPKPIKQASGESPTINIEVHPPKFSPNEDGLDDGVIIYAEASEDVRWVVYIKNPHGEYIQKILGDKSRRFKARWKGLDNLGETVPDGEYTIELIAKGDRGETLKTATVEVSGSPSPPKFPKKKSLPPRISNAKVSPPKFSPNGDGVNDSVVISAEASEEIEEWLVSIVNVEDKESYEKIWGIKGKRLRIDWDGVSHASGRPVPNGKYMVLIYAEGEGGIARASIPLEVVDSPNKNKAKTKSRRIPKERIEEAPSGITMSNIRLPWRIGRGEASRGTVVFHNAEARDRAVVLTMTLSPHPSYVSVIPDTANLLIPAGSSASQEFKILPEKWAAREEYSLEFRLQEDGEEVYYGALPIKIGGGVQRTAVKIDSDTLVVVRSDLPVDFFSAQSYTEPNGAPIIRLNPGGLTEEDLERLNGYIGSGIRRAVIVGGPEAVPFSIEYQLQVFGFNVERIGGANRYETASLVSLLWEAAETAVIGSGEDPELLEEACRLAISRRAPLLLSKPIGLPRETLQALHALGVKKAIIGPGVQGPVVEELEGEGIAVG